MKIGFYGGLANNMYVFAKAFAAVGKTILFIKDITDTFPFSQPVWEDIPFVFDTQKLNESFSYEDWCKFEHNNGYKSPDWHIDIKQANTFEDAFFQQTKVPFISPLLNRYLRKKYLSKERLKVIDFMRTCNLLIVCGVEGAILAMLSGRPYMIWPHGGDIRLAAGLTKLESKSFRQYINNYIYSLLISRAFKKSNWIATHDPQGVGCWFGKIDKILKNKNLEHLPIPLPRVAPYSSSEKASKRENLSKIFNIVLDAKDIIFFVPSRIDFYWKEQYKIINAIQSDHKFKLIFSGWGKDYESARRLVVERNLGDKIQFLPYALSKPLLREFFLCSDVVFDQFRIGTYGTAAVEAMACGLPVVMHIQDHLFESRGWCPPPVIKAHSEQDIKRVFDKIDAGILNIQSIGQQCADWVQKYHSPQAVLERFFATISETVL